MSPFLKEICRNLPSGSRKEPVVILPLGLWKKVEEALEDLEMYTSEKLRRDIKKGRREARGNQTLTLDEVEKELLKIR